MHDVSGQLTSDELAGLFEGHTRLVEHLSRRADPLAEAEDVIAELSDDERVEALDAHPPIGARRLSEASAREQGADEDPQLLAELERLNGEYERRFGFRFVVFVAGRSRREIVPVLRERLGRSREEELAIGLRELVAIARDRWSQR